jgi:hypothetical protein
MYSGGKAATGNWECCIPDKRTGDGDLGDFQALYEEGPFLETLHSLQVLRGPTTGFAFSELRCFRRGTLLDCF